MKKIRLTLGFVSLAMVWGFSLANSADDAGGLALHTRALKSEIPLDDLLNPLHEIWNHALAQPIHLNRTPPLYTDGPYDNGVVPQAEVRVIRRQDSSAAVWIHWSDASEDGKSNGQRFPDGGEKHIYKTQTRNTAGFSDAVCAMIPQQRGPSRQYPSLMMGDVNAPVEMYFWKAGTGFSILGAHGRSSTQTTASSEQGQAVRQGDGWTVVQVIPNLAVDTPLCFAIWDGNEEHRDGLKYYSLWYEVK